MTWMTPLSATSRGGDFGVVDFNAAHLLRSGTSPQLSDHAGLDVLDITLPGTTW